MAFVIILPHSNWHARVDWRHSEQLCAPATVCGALYAVLQPPSCPWPLTNHFMTQMLCLSHPHVAELPHLFIIPYGRWCPTTSRKAIVFLAP